MAGLTEAQLLGAAVLLQGQSLRDVQRLVALGMREVERRDGIVPPARVAEVERLLRQAADLDRLRQRLSPGGRVLGESGGVRPDWEPARRLTTRQAAAMLQLSERQVRRKAATLGGCLIGPILTFDGDLVAQLAACLGPSRAARTRTRAAMSSEE